MKWGIGEWRIIIGNSLQVAHLHLGLCRQGYGAEDTRQAEHILTLKEGSIRVAIYLNCNDVFTLLIKVRSDVELCQVAWVLWETYVMAVDIEVEERVNTVEVNVHFLTVPISWNGKGATIRTYFVAVLISHPVLLRRAHHTTFPIAHLYLVLEDDTLIRVKRFAILKCAVALCTCHVPWHGHLYLIPTWSIEVCAIKVLDAFVRVLGPVELPLAIKTLPKRAILGQHLASLVNIGKWEEPSMRLLLIISYRIRTLPLPASRVRHLSIVKTSQRCDLCPHWSRHQRR